MQLIQVIGVVKNFNFESLRNPIQPYILLLQDENNYWGYITVRLSPANYSATINEIEKIWKEYASNSPLQYYFLDADFEKMYSQEKQNARMAMIFSLLAIFIASLGLVWPYILYRGTANQGDRGKKSNGLIDYRHIY